MALDFALARENMIKNDVRTNDVTDRRLLAAMRAVPREQFVAPARREIAYGDLCVPLAPGRALLDPRTFSKLAQAAAIGPEDRVLDVGCAMGYSAVVLARLAGEVVALEQDETLARAAEANFAALGVENIALERGRLVAGAPALGPFDVIMIEGMVEEVPAALTAQLKEAGRLLAVIAYTGHLGRAMIFMRVDNVVSGRALFDATVPLLPGFERKKSFVF